MSDEAIGVLLPRIGTTKVLGGFTGAVLDGCVIDGNKVVLETGETYEQPDAPGTTTMWANQSMGVRINQNTLGVSKLGEFTIFTTSKGVNCPDVWCQVYDATTSTLIKTVTVLAASVPSAGALVFDLDEVVVDSSNAIDLRVGFNGGTDSGFGFNASFDSTEGLEGFTRIATSNNWSSVGSTSTTQSLKFTLESISSITGTVTIDRTLDTVYKWGSSYYNKTIPVTPGTQTVSLAIKDTDDNVLIASVADKQSIASINPTTYPAIREVYTLTRADGADDSPALSAPLVSYIGTGGD